MIEKGLRMANVGLVPLVIADNFSAQVGNQIYGLPVIDYHQDITRTIRLNRIETALINLPEAEHKEVTAVFNRLNSGLNDIRIVPRMEEWKESVHQIHAINIEDLLARQSVKIDFQGISENGSTKRSWSPGRRVPSVRKLCASCASSMCSRLSPSIWMRAACSICAGLLPYLTDGQCFSYVVASICNRHKMQSLFREHSRKLFSMPRLTSMCR